MSPKGTLLSRFRVIIHKKIAIRLAIGSISDSETTERGSCLASCQFRFLSAMVDSLIIRRSELEKLLTIVAAFTHILGQEPSSIEGQSVVWHRDNDPLNAPYAVISYDQDSFKVSCE
jgi:hypothetical protein